MNILHIAASPKTDIQSSSKRVGDAFVQAYLKHQQQAAYSYIDVNKRSIPAMTDKLLQAFEGTVKPEGEEVKALQIYDDLCDEFIAADRYVISFPHWNLTAPPVLIAYFLAVARIGKTFQYTEQGVKGLLQHKKAAIVVSSGGICSNQNPQTSCMAVDWLIRLLSICGVQDTQVIYCEGLQQMSEKTEELIAQAIQKAQHQGAVWDNESRDV